MFCCGAAPNTGEVQERTRRKLASKRGQIYLGERFRSMVASNGLVVFKDVPRLVHRTRVFRGLPTNIGNDHHPSTIVFSAVDTAYDLSVHATPSGNAQTTESKLAKETSSLTSEQRTARLNCRLVSFLKQLLGEEMPMSQTKTVHGNGQMNNKLDTETTANADKKAKTSTLNIESSDTRHFTGVTTADSDEFELENVFAKAYSEGPHADKSRTWSVLQAVNQNCIFPMIGELISRLARSKITRLPLLDARTSDAWTVDIFVKTDSTHDFDSSKEGGASTKQSREVNDRKDPMEFARTAVIVRHCRRSRSSDPDWPFNIIYHLDIHFALCDSNGSDSDNCYAQLKQDKQSSTEPLLCQFALGSVVACEFNSNGMEKAIARKKVSLLRTCFGLPQDLDNIQWSSTDGWKLTGGV